MCLSTSLDLLLEAEGPTCQDATSSSCVLTGSSTRQKLGEMLTEMRRAHCDVLLLSVRTSGLPSAGRMTVVQLIASTHGRSVGVRAEIACCADLSSSSLHGNTGTPVSCRCRSVGCVGLLVACQEVHFRACGDAVPPEQAGSGPGPNSDGPLYVPAVPYSTWHVQALFSGGPRCLILAALGPRTAAYLVSPWWVCVSGSRRLLEFRGEVVLLGPRFVAGCSCL